MTKDQMTLEALHRAESGTSESNYRAIMQGFALMGIESSEIIPRENVFTFHAWKAKGRSVKKGVHGVRIQTVIETETKDGERKGRKRMFTTVFHVSQTEPTGENSQRETPRQASQPRSERPASQDGLADRFRAMASTLTPQIANLTRPMTQNPTPKRNREYQSRLWEGRNASRLQRALIAMADAHDAGTVPADLAQLRTKGEIAGLVHKGLDRSRGGYYAVIEAADYQDTTPAGRKLQVMIEGTASVEETKKLKIQELEAQIALSNIPGFFPTPQGLAEMMCEIADIQPGMSVLEPSAGSGSIADAILAACPGAEIDCYEINSSLRELLKLKGYNTVTKTPDFLDEPVSWVKYDRILMNPPFEDQQDIDHVRRAYDHLTPDGVLVAILGPSFEFRTNDKSTMFREWLEEVGASWDEIPAGAFKQSGTMVASRLMVIDKRSN